MARFFGLWALHPTPKPIQTDIVSLKTVPEHMNRTLKKVAVLAVSAIATLTFVPSNAWSEWTSGVQGGAVVRNGDTSNRLRAFVSNQSRPLSHYLYADWIFSSGDDSYELGYRPRYWFTPALYSFGELSFRSDDDIGIDSETTEALGAGYQFLNTDTQSAFAELAIGAQQMSFTNSTLDDLSQFFTQARAGYSQSIGKAARFQLNGSARFSDDIQESVAEVGITVFVNTLAVTLGYRVIEQRIFDLPAISDDTTTVSLNYRL